MIPRKTIQGAAALLALAMPLAPFQAATQSVRATITRTLASDGGFGACMAGLSVDVGAETGLNCTTRWVTFSCTGEHTSKANGRRMFDQAQLAFVTGRRVQVWVTDDKKTQGHCFASRIDVLAE